MRRPLPLALASAAVERDYSRISSRKGFSDDFLILFGLGLCGVRAIALLFSFYFLEWVGSSFQEKTVDHDLWLVTHSTTPVSRCAVAIPNQKARWRVSQAASVMFPAIVLFLLFPYQQFVFSLIFSQRISLTGMPSRIRTVSQKPVVIDLW